MAPIRAITSVVIHRGAARMGGSCQAAPQPIGPYFRPMTRPASFPVPTSTDVACLYPWRGGGSERSRSACTPDTTGFSRGGQLRAPRRPAWAAYTCFKRGERLYTSPPRRTAKPHLLHARGAVWRWPVCRFEPASLFPACMIDSGLGEVCGAGHMFPACVNGLRGSSCSPLSRSLFPACMIDLRSRVFL